MKILISLLILISFAAFSQDGVSVRSRNGNATNLTAKGTTTMQKLVATNVYSASLNATSTLAVATTALVVTNDNVGVGTASPGDYKLNVQGGTARTLIQSSNELPLYVNGSSTWSGILFGNPVTSSALWYHGGADSFALGGGGANAWNKLNVFGSMAVGQTYYNLVAPTNGMAIEGGVKIGNYAGIGTGNISNDYSGVKLQVGSKTNALGQYPGVIFYDNVGFGRAFRPDGETNDVVVYIGSRDISGLGGVDLESAGGNLYSFASEAVMQATGGNNRSHHGAWVQAYSRDDGANRTLQNQYGIIVGAPQKGGTLTITNSYGIYIQAPTVGITNTGIWNEGTSRQVGTARFDDTVSIWGNVGIGTTSPAGYFDDGDAVRVLEIKGNGRTGIRLSDSSGENQFLNIGVNGSAAFIEAIYSATPNIKYKADGYHAFFTYGTERMRITSDGNVGIGVTPLSTVDIYKSTVAGVVEGAILAITGVKDENDFAGIRFGEGPSLTTGAQKGGIFFEKTAAFGLGSLHFATDATADDSNATLADARLTVTSAGNVGIGTATPQAKLDVIGDIRASLTVGATNGLVLFQRSTIPTNSIPASSALVTNYVLVNLTNTINGGGPMFVATNYTAAGSFLLSKPTLTETVWP